MITSKVQSHKKLLVVEDDESIRVLLDSILTSEGYKVESAENGLDALETIQRSGLPDLILLDMVMPEMDAWKFASEFRSRYCQTVPLVAMTAATNAEEKAKDIQAAGWVEKPFLIDALLNVVKLHAGG